MGVDRHLGVLGKSANMGVGVGPVLQPALVFSAFRWLPFRFKKLYSDSGQLNDFVSVSIFHGVTKETNTSM